MAAILLCLHYPRLDSRLAPSLVAMVIGDFHMLNPWLAITFQAMRLGHRSVQHTVRHTELSPTRFKDFWR